MTPRQYAEVLAYRRVLRLVNSYLKRQRADLLVTDGRGLMTWGEIRYHITAALGLRAHLSRAPVGAKRRQKKSSLRTP